MSVEKSISFLKRRGTLITLVFFLINISMTFLFRFFNDNPLIYGKNTFYDLNLMKIYLSEIPGLNSLAYSLFSFPGSQIIQILFSVVFGVSFLVLFINLLEKFNIKKEIIFLTSIVLTISPNFIYLFTTFNRHAVFMFLYVLAFFLLMKEKRKVALLLLAICASASIFNALFAILIIYFFTRIKKEMITPTKIITFGTLFLIPLLLQKQYFLNISYSATMSLSEFFFEFGSFLGINTFLLIFFTIGLVKIWKKRTWHFPFFMLLFVLFNSAAIGVYSLAYSLPFIAFFASHGILSLLRLNWESTLISEIIYLLMICGLLFPLISFFDEAGTSQPTFEMVEAIRSSESSQGYFVLSHEDYGFIIDYFGENKAYLNNYDKNNNQEYFRKKNIAHETFNSRKESRIINNAESENIKFIMITSEMKKGLIFDRDDQGILFLLEDSETFKRRFLSDNIEVYEIQYEEMEE